MYHEWIKSPSFWLSLLTPLVTIALLGTPVGGSIRHQDRFVTMAGVSMAAAILVGLWLAARERHAAAALLAARGHEDFSRSFAPRREPDTYRDLFDNAADIVFTADLSGHFLAGNKAIENVLGYTVGDAGRLTWEKLAAPHDLWKVRQLCRRHASGEAQSGIELEAVTASGETRTLEIGSRPIFRGGEPCGFHGIARDVTPRKEIEKRLESARREAESDSAAKSAFLANMSHEIRTPINGILGFLSLFAKTSLTPRQKEYLAPIEESARRLVKIINDVLDLSRIEAGGFSIDNEIFDYREVVVGTVNLLRPLAEEKGLLVTSELDPRIPALVVGDGTRVGQVLTNLVNNAIKFTDAGGVRVASRVRHAGPSRVSIEVSVRDTGTGIDPAHQERLFQPFQQMGAAPHRRATGTGLGLAISKSLVEAMGGDIRVSGAPGEYTEVVFELPLDLPPDPIRDPAGEPAADRKYFNGAGLTALVVDDSRINRWYLDAALGQYGFRGTQASSGGEALAACREHRFDLVLMDVHMAGGDGVETTRRLRTQLPDYRRVPVVGVSADVLGHRGSRYIRQGLDHFLAKPVKEASLIDLLCRIFPDRVPRHGAAAVSCCGGDDTNGSEVLDRVQGVALAANDEGLWRRSVDVLRARSRKALPRIRTALGAGDYAGVRQAAHGLAGSAGYVAARQVACCARALEHAAKLEEPEAAKGRLFELQCAIERLLGVDIDEPA